MKQPLSMLAIGEVKPPLVQNGIRERSATFKHIPQFSYFWSYCQDILALLALKSFKSGPIDQPDSLGCVFSGVQSVRTEQYATPACSGGAQSSQSMGLADKKILSSNLSVGFESPALSTIKHIANPIRSIHRSVFRWDHKKWRRMHSINHSLAPSYRLWSLQSTFKEQGPSRA